MSDWLKYNEVNIKLLLSLHQKCIEYFGFHVNDFEIEKINNNVYDDDYRKESKFLSGAISQIFDNLLKKCIKYRIWERGYYFFQQFLIKANALDERFFLFSKELLQLNQVNLILINYQLTKNDGKENRDQMITQVLRYDLNDKYEMSFEEEFSYYENNKYFEAEYFGRWSPERNGLINFDKFIMENIGQKEITSKMGKFTCLIVNTSFMNIQKLKMS